MSKEDSTLKNRCKARLRIAPVEEPKHPYYRPIPFRQLLPPPHDTVQWWIDRTHMDMDDDKEPLDIRIVYQGTPEDLIAAGCGPAKLIGPWKVGSRRVDSDGRWAHVQKLKGKSKGQIRFIRYMSIESAIGLPGITREIIERYVAHYRIEWREWKRRPNPRSSAPEQQEQPTPINDRRLIDECAAALRRFQSVAAGLRGDLAGYIEGSIENVRGRLDSARDRLPVAERRSHLRLVVDNTLPAS